MLYGPFVSSRDGQIARVLWIVLGLNGAVAVSKLGVGYSLDILSLIADGVHSVLDGSSNVVGLVGLSVAARPPDRGHPYGHRRFEAMAALGIGALISLAFVEIIRHLVESVQGAAPPPRVTLAATIVVVLTICINFGISRYEARQGRLLGSAILEADAAHTMSDALAACAVLLSFAGIAVGWAWADWVGAAVVAVFVGRTALNVIRSNIGILSDSAQLDEQAVLEATLAVPGVHHAHQIRSRGDAHDIHLDLHIHLDGEQTLVEAHRKTHEVKAALMSRFPGLTDVVIHTEPAATPSEDNAPSERLR